jgi:hypothetical protein
MNPTVDDVDGLWLIRRAIVRMRSSLTAMVC